MCLVYLLGLLAVGLTALSGQYSDHDTLFWLFIGALFINGFSYSMQRRLLPDCEGQAQRTFILFSYGTGIGGLASLVFFIWLMIVIWI